MATEVGNNARLAIASGAVDFSGDTFKICLMDTGFTFNEDTHEGWADVSADELAELNGYVQDTKTLAGVGLVVNTTTARCDVTWDNVTWTASGGSIGPTAGAIIYDDSVTAAGDIVADTIIGYIDFGSDITQAAGGTLTIQNIKVTI